MRILLIEDEAGWATSIKRLLYEQKHSVDWVRDGAAGLARVASNGYDLIVLEATLPSLDGCAIARCLRAVGDTTPIMMLGPGDDIADRLEGLDAGADDYLVKPFAPTEFLARVRALSRRRRPTKR